MNPEAAFLLEPRYTVRCIRNVRIPMASDASAFHLTIQAEVTIDGLPHFSRRWVRSYPRGLL